MICHSKRGRDEGREKREKERLEAEVNGIECLTKLMGQCSLAPFLTRFLRNVPGLEISCLGLAAWAKLKRNAPVPHTVCVSELGSAATLTCQ